MLKKLIHDTAGTSALEYGILAALISIAAAAAISVLGGQTQARMETVDTAYQETAGPAR